MCSPEVNLCERLQQLRPHQPVRAALQAQHVGEQLQAQVAVAAVAEARDAVLESKATALASGPAQAGAASGALGCCWRTLAPRLGATVAHASSHSARV